MGWRHRGILGNGVGVRGGMVLEGEEKEVFPGKLMVLKCTHFLGSLLLCLGIPVPFINFPGSAEINFKIQFSCDLL